MICIWLSVWMGGGEGDGGVNQLTVSGNRVINARMNRAKQIISVKEGGGDDDDDDDDEEEEEEVAVADIIIATSSITNDFHSFCRPSNLHNSDCASGPRRETTVEGF